MKRLLLSLVLFAGIVASAWAAPTAKAIYCAENTTLYFTYDEVTYNTSTAYEQLDGNTPTNIYASLDPTKKYASSITGYVTGYNDRQKKYEEHPEYILPMKDRDWRTKTPWAGIISSITTIKILDNFKDWKPVVLDCYFMGMSNLTTIIGGDNLNTSEVTSMNETFCLCTSLTNLDFLSNWNVEKVIYMSGLFHYCKELTDISGLTNWTTTSLKSMASTFDYCLKLTNLEPIGNWNVSSVTSMGGCFKCCESITTLEDLAQWNVESLAGIAGMFAGCISLTDIGILQNWDVSKVESLRGLFPYCYKVTNYTAISGWNVSNVWDFEYMFRGCDLVNLDFLSSWDTSKAERMEGTFQFNETLTDIKGITNWATSNVKIMDYMFNKCTSLSDFSPISGWNVGNVSTIEYAFYNCALSDLSFMKEWTTTNMAEIRGIFCLCKNLSNIETLKNLDWTNLRNAQSAFYGCTGLKGHIDFSFWDLSNLDNTWRSVKINVTENGYTTYSISPIAPFQSMFYGCTGITGITFGKGNIGTTTLVTDYQKNSNTFANCPNLRFIDFSNCTDPVGNVVAVDRDLSNDMFYKVPLTTVIYLPKGNTKPASGDVTNVVYTTSETDETLICDEYYSEDKVDIEFPHDFKTPKAIYTRNVGSTYGSVILPYEFKTDKDNIFAFTLNKEYSTFMYFVETPSVAAHAPFAFKKVAELDIETAATTLGASDETTIDSDGNTVSKQFGNTNFSMASDDGGYSITVTATNTTSASEKTVAGDDGTPYTDATAAITDEAANKWTTKGYYVNETVEDFDGTFYIAGDKFWKADGALTMYLHRVTFHGEWEKGSGKAISTGAKEINFVMADVETAIEAAEAREAEKNEIYDMQGRQQNKLNRGMNIVRMSDGSVRKIMVK